MPYTPQVIIVPSRNTVVNGDLLIDQPNVGAAISINSASTQRGPDCTKAQGTASAGVFSFAQATATPLQSATYGYFTNYLHFITTTADATPATGAIYIQYFTIEASIFNRFGFGAATAHPVILSFMARSSIANFVLGGALLNNSTNRSYPFQVTLGAANTAQLCSFYIPGDVSGTWTGGALVQFDIGCGATFQGTAGAWVGSTILGVSGDTKLISTLSATLDITGVSVIDASPSGQMAPFEFIPIQEQLARCQRYYEKSFAQATAPAQNVGLGTGEFRFNASIIAAAAERSPSIMLKVVKRVTPTITLYNPAATNAQIRDITASVDCSSSATANISDEQFCLTATGDATTVVGDSLGVHWTADSRN